jgi:hypothetical protein
MYELPALWAEHNVVQGNVTRVAISNASFESHLQQKEDLSPYTLVCTQRKKYFTL